MKHVARLLIFRNGMIGAFDEHGQQMPEIQNLSLPDIIRSELERMGYSVDGCRVSLWGMEHVYGEQKQ